MLRKKQFWLNSVLILAGLGLVALGVFVNFFNPETVSLTGQSASVTNLGGGLTGQIYLQESLLDEDVESNLVLDIQSSEASLGGFNLELTVADKFLVYCNSVKLENTTDTTVVNSYICTNQDQVLSLTFDLEPKPPFKIQLRTLNREPIDQIQIQYKISTPQTLIDQGELVVINNQPTRAKAPLNIKLIWYILCGLFAVCLVSYLIWHFKSSKP
jgi:hypothetical protein